MLTGLDVPAKMRLAEERIALERLEVAGVGSLTVGRFDQLREDLELERSLRKRAEARVLELMSEHRERRLAFVGPTESATDSATDLATQLRAAFDQDSVHEYLDRSVCSIQHVLGATGEPAGTILWIVRDTDPWNSDWIVEAKLQRIEAGAGTVVIVHESLPHPIIDLGQVEGVWVSRPSHTIQLATLLRHSAIETTLARRQAESRSHITGDMRPW